MNSQTEATYIKLFDEINERLTSSEFLERHRVRVQDFTRKRCLPFVTLVLFMLNMLKCSLQDELDGFFKALNNTDVAIREVTKSAFTMARKKLKFGAFVELNDVQVGHFYEKMKHLTWHGFRILATDGSSAQLYNNEDIIAHFGLWNGHPMARISQMFDVLNKVTVDAQIAHKSNGERVLAALHFEKIGEGDLILMDRGYPAFWLFALILFQGANFCARMPIGVWGVVDQFIATGLDEQQVELHPCDKAIKECKNRKLSTDPLTVRLIRIELDDGSVEVLITSLLDTVAFPISLFKDLYHLRWPVEEDYKCLKSRMEVENWSGKSVHAVYQDFHANIFTKNLTAIIAVPAQQQVEEQTDNRKLDYKVNFTNALSKMKDTVVLLFQRPVISPLLQNLWDLMVKTIEPIRPGRNSPRNKKSKSRKFAVAYKPIR